jgi:hypothetical protein
MWDFSELSVRVKKKFLFNFISLNKLLFKKKSLLVFPSWLKEVEMEMEGELEWEVRW